MNVVIYVFALIGAITVVCAILLTISEWITSRGQETLAEMKARIEKEERARWDEAHKLYLYSKSEDK